MSNGSSDTGTLLARLVERPFDFDFVQAVTLLQTQLPNSGLKGHEVGFDHAPDDEAVRFRVAPTLRKSSSQVVSAIPGEGSASCYELTVPFIGLIGANGVLPRHYTQVVISRVKQHDYAMRDFYDLFHHRIVSMFFRASVKYRLPYVYQSRSIQSAASNDSQISDDSITQVIRCLVGLGEPSLKQKLSISDHNFLHYSGHFSDDKPTAHSLERVVEDFVGLPTRVLQFQFEWLYIDPSEQSKLSPTSSNQLGCNVVIGARVPSIQSRFRVRIGPVKWHDFIELLPNSNRVTHLADLIRVYVGISLDFDLQVTVEGREIPRLVFSREQPPKLGWNTWLISKPIETVVDDAVFDIGAF